MILLSSADFFFYIKVNFFKKLFQEHCQCVWIQIRIDDSKEIVKPYDSLHMKYYFSNMFWDVIESSIFFIYFICLDKRNF